MRVRATIQSLKSQLLTAEVEVTNAANALGNHLDPGDQAVGEPICTWVLIEFRDERLVESTKTDDSGNGSYSVRFRSDKKAAQHEEKSDG
jgi:hypothetical protein